VFTRSPCRRSSPRSSRAPATSLRAARAGWILLALALLALAGCHRKRGQLRLPPTLDAKTDFALALRQSLGTALRPGNEVAIFPNGHVFDALEEAIGAARASIDVVVYIWEKGAASDRMVAAITPRARAGVACRILVDAFGSSDFEKDVKPALTDAGCDARVFRPIPGVADEARNHRKIVVIDGAVGFTGGFGVRDDWLGNGESDAHWRDTNVRVKGPAVSDMQQAFAENWQEAGGPLLGPDAFPFDRAPGAAAGVTDSPGPGAPTGGVLAAFVASTGAPVVTRAERLTQLAVATAKKRLWISNAYFVPSRAILDELGEKARAGVDVRILSPGRKSDSKPAFFSQHAEYGDLVKAGVRVWEYLPSMMHAKTMVVDDGLAVIGSINLDPLSLNILDEGALVIEDPATVEALAALFVADMARSEEKTEKRR
jgi:cardiolipin synthase